MLVLTLSDGATYKANLGQKVVSGLDVTFILYEHDSALIVACYSQQDILYNEKRPFFFMYMHMRYVCIYIYIYIHIYIYIYTYIYIYMCVCVCACVCVCVCVCVRV